MGFHTSDDDIAKALRSYSNGDTFSLFKLALESIYNSRHLLDDANFIINMFKNVSNIDDKNSFIDFLFDKHIYFDQLYIENNQEQLQRFNDYWKNNIPQPAPLIFSLIPYLTDEQLAKVLQDGIFNDLAYLDNSKNLAESLLLKFFEINNYKSVISLHENQNYFLSRASFYDSKIYPGETEEKYLSDILTKFIEDEPKLLLAYGKLQSYSFTDKCEQWLTNQLDKERRNHILLHDFFENVFEHLPQDGQELIIARTLYRTNNLDYTMMALNKIGIKDITDYKPKDYPIWLYAADHQNTSIYRKLLRSGISLFDYYPPSSKTFFTVILDGPCYKEKLSEILEEQKIEPKDFIKELLQKKVDEQGIEYSNYSLVSASQDSRTLKMINLKFSDLALYKKKFSQEKFKLLTIKEKLNLLNDVMDRTLLSPTYVSSNYINKYTKEYLAKKVVNFNVLTHNLSNYEVFGELIERHLDLLEQVDFAVCDYRPKYFEIVKQMFDRYDAGYLSTSVNLYNVFSKIIDYTATDNSLNWGELSEILSTESINNKKPNFAEGSLEIYNYLQKVCFSHELKTSNTSEKKKLKI
jgi:hypothetical protein